MVTSVKYHNIKDYKYKHFCLSFLDILCPFLWMIEYIYFRETLAVACLCSLTLFVWMPPQWHLVFPLPNALPVAWIINFGYIWWIVYFFFICPHNWTVKMWDAPLCYLLNYFKCLFCWYKKVPWGQCAHWRPYRRGQRGGGIERQTLKVNGPCTTQGYIAL